MAQPSASTMPRMHWSRRRKVVASLISLVVILLVIVGVMTRTLFLVWPYGIAPDPWLRSDYQEVTWPSNLKQSFATYYRSNSEGADGAGYRYEYSVSGTRGQVY